MTLATLEDRGSVRPLSQGLLAHHSIDGERGTTGTTSGPLYLWRITTAPCSSSPGRILSCAERVLRGSTSPHATISIGGGSGGGGVWFNSRCRVVTTHWADRGIKVTSHLVLQCVSCSVHASTVQLCCSQPLSDRWDQIHAGRRQDVGIW